MLGVFFDGQPDGVVRRLELSRGVSGLLGGSRHQLQGGLPQRERAGPAGAAIEKGLGKPADIIGCREQSGIACHSTHAACRWVMHGTAKEVAVVGGVDARGGVFVTRRRSDAHQEPGAPRTCRTSTDPRHVIAECDCGSADLVRTTCFGRGKVAAVVHAQWGGKDVVLHVIVQGLTGDLLDDRAKQDEVDVGVVKEFPLDRTPPTRRGHGECLRPCRHRPVPPTDRRGSDLPLCPMCA